MPQDDIQSTLTLVASTAARLDSHENTCGERYNRIASDTTEIKATLLDMARKLDAATQRVHDRIDSVAVEARNNANLALAAAQTAADGVRDVKIWVLSSVGVACMAVISWFANMFFGRHP